MSESTAAEHAKTDGCAAGEDRISGNFFALPGRFVVGMLARYRAIVSALSRLPAFRLLVVGSSISMLGSRISTVAFPMLVLHLNNSPFITGLVTFAAIAPSMLFYIPAGVLVDRWNPRRVMLNTELGRGVTIASIVIALVLFKEHVNIWFLILAMVVEEILEIFFTLADRRYMNRVMEDDKIDSQQSSFEVRSHAAVLAGRPIGPFLFTLQPFLPFLADALSFIASIVSLLLLKGTGEQPGQARRLLSKDTVRRIGKGIRNLRKLLSEEVRDDIKSGFKWLKNDRRAGLTVALMAMTSLIAQALILMFLVEAHSKQLSTLAVGIVLAASGAGGAVGSFCARKVSGAMRSYWLPIQMIAWSVMLFFLAFVGGQSAYFSAPAMFILGLTGAIGNVEYGTYLNRNAADNMIGKIAGIGQMLTIGACALGPVLGGYAVQHFKVAGAIWILFAIVIVAALVSLLMPGLGKQLKRWLQPFKRDTAEERQAVAGQGAVVGHALPEFSSAHHDQNSDRWQGITDSDSVRRQPEMVDYG